MQAADFLQIIGYVDTGFVVVEVTACSFVVFLEWWMTDDKILQSVFKYVHIPHSRRELGILYTKLNIMNPPFAFTANGGFMLLSFHT